MSNPYSNGFGGAYPQSGPTSGSTPADDADLHDNNGAFPTGTPRADRTADTGDGFTVSGYGGASGQYYAPPAVSGSGNPYANGPADQYATGNSQIGGGFEELYAAILDQQQPTYADQPTSADYHRDIGHGSDGMGSS